jgi:hypothetical protein
MRTAVLTLLGSMVLSTATMPANAGPTATNPGAPTMSNVVQVSGCGWGFYRDMYGYCQPYNYAAWYGAPSWYGDPYPHWYYRDHYRHHDHHQGQ